MPGHTSEVWSLAVSMTFSEPMGLMFGGGFRSLELHSSIGGIAEDPYTSILLDSGLFAGAAIIAIYIYAAIKALGLSRAAP